MSIPYTALYIAFTTAIFKAAIWPWTCWAENSLGTTPSSVIPSKPLPEGTDLILIRASDSKNGRSKSNTSRTKLTTFVAPSELDKFYERYATMCKAGMLGLKPRDKSKKKSQQKKKKKRAAATAEE